jgi:hypothetical protein
VVKPSAKLPSVSCPAESIARRGVPYDMGMDETRPAKSVKIVTREELAHAFHQWRRPGWEVVFGALGGLVQQSIDAWVRSQPFDWPAGLQAALIGAALLWGARFVGHLWMAPRHIAAGDRQALEAAYGRLVEKSGTSAKRAAQLESQLSRERTAAYSVMARALEETRHLRGFNLREMPDDLVALWEDRYDEMVSRMWDELRPHVKEHEFHVLLYPDPDDVPQPIRGSPLAELKYLLLPGLSLRLAKLMEKYQ